MVEEVQRRLDNDGESVEADFKFHICLAELSDSRFFAGDHRHAEAALDLCWFFCSKSRDDKGAYWEAND
jgi:DNA-binding FadR family transcriptional regulator